MLPAVKVPIKYFRTVPVHDAFEAVDMLIDRFEIFDSMRLTADIGVDRERHDLGPRRTLGIETFELIDGAFEQVVALVMLHDHHRYVVELDRIRERHELAVGGADRR